MGEIKSNSKRVPNIPNVPNVPNLKNVPNRGPVTAKSSKPLRKSGRGR